ncbi:TetR/AcrR family transcriptional regulator C-terminal domain-containing protein [Saccharothrix violaceirubra]|uniref:AcrR family transcriptional regulator n=1 Tax=Saccharothrix violaceirubra TaxID=413306 RepID=A0A7W7WX29_9PSEU|nr:TetR/AcrR family transcriptional regulator [Saccharothrix violaceirubra]MBB4967009.1 AcrR family transcriptional regulator [Saccharothrix violaceirubra]
MPERRRGRPRAGEAAARREAALDAALALLVEHGVDGLTMAAVAARAGSSKESLYNWFDNRAGLLAELVRRQARDVATDLPSGSDSPEALRDRLTTIAENLLLLLVGPPSLAINRAAMGSPELAGLVLRHGRHTTGPAVEAYLAANDIADPPEAFRLLYGLVVADHQIRALLGEEPPTPERVRREAGIAVDRFLRLTAG